MPLTARELKLAVTYDELEKTVKENEFYNVLVPKTFRHLYQGCNLITAVDCKRLAKEFANLILPDYKNVDGTVLVNINRDAYIIMLFRNMLEANQLKWNQCPANLKILIAGGDRTVINDRSYPLFLQVEQPAHMEIHPLPKIFCLTIPETIAIICAGSHPSETSSRISSFEQSFRDKLVPRLSFIKQNRNDINRLLQDTSKYRNLFIYAVERNQGYFYRSVDITSARDFLSGNTNTLALDIQNLTVVNRQEIFATLKIECSKSLEQLFVYYTQFEHQDRLRETVNKTCVLKAQMNNETKEIQTKTIYFKDYISEEMFDLAKKNEALFIAYSELTNRDGVDFRNFVVFNFQYYISSNQEAFNFVLLLNSAGLYGYDINNSNIKSWCDCKNRADVELTDYLQNQECFLISERCLTSELYLIDLRKIKNELEQKDLEILEHPYTKDPYRESEVERIIRFMKEKSDGLAARPINTDKIREMHNKRNQLSNRNSLSDPNNLDNPIWIDNELYALIDFLHQNSEKETLESPITQKPYSTLGLERLINCIKNSSSHIVTATNIYGAEWEQRLLKQHSRAKAKDEPDEYLVTAEDDIFLLAELYEQKQYGKDFTNPKTELPFHEDEKEKIQNWVQNNKPDMLSRVKEQMLFSDYRQNSNGKLLSDDHLCIFDLNELYTLFQDLPFIENPETHQPFSENEKRTILEFQLFNDNRPEWERKFSLRSQLKNREDFATIPSAFFMTKDGIGFDPDILRTILDENLDSKDFLLRVIPRWIATSEQISTDIPQTTRTNFQFSDSVSSTPGNVTLGNLHKIIRLIFDEYCINAFDKEIDVIQARILPIQTADDKVEYHVVNDSDLVEHILAEQNLFLPALSARIPESTIHSLKTLAEIPLLDKERINHLNKTEDMLTFYSRTHTIIGKTPETLRKIILMDNELRACENEHNINGDKNITELKLLDAIIIIKEDNKSYAFDIEELTDYLMDNLTLANPFSKKQFSQQTIEAISKKSSRPNLITIIKQQEFLKRALAGCANSVPPSTPLDRLVCFSENSSRYAFDINTLASHFATTKKFTNPVTNNILDDLTLILLHGHQEFQKNAAVKQMWEIRLLTAKCINQTLITNSTVHLTNFSTEQIVIKEIDQKTYAYSTQELIDYAISKQKLVFPNTSEQLDADTIVLMLKQAATIEKHNHIHLLNITKNCQKQAAFTITNLLITDDGYAINVKTAYKNINPITETELSANDKNRAKIIRELLAKLERCRNYESIVTTDRFISADPLSEVIILDNYAFTVDRLVTEFREHKKFLHSATKQQFSPEQMDAILASDAFNHHIHNYPEAKEITLKLNLYGATPANEQTLMYESIYDIPHERFFVTASAPHYVFDIAELVTEITKNHKLYNPYTNTEFSVLDCQKLHKFISVHRTVWQIHQQLLEQQNLPTDIFAMVKEFVINMYFNDGDADKSNAALHKFLDQQKTMPNDTATKLGNFLLLENNSLLTFSEIIDDITTANACAHIVSKKLWKIIYTVNPDAITEICANRQTYSYANPLIWKEQWDKEDTFPKAHLRAMNMDHSMWEDNPDASPSAAPQAFFQKPEVPSPENDFAHSTLTYGN